MSGGKSGGKPSDSTIRVGGAMAITAVLRDLGIDPVEVLVEAGIAPTAFDDPDNLITYRARGRLMTRSVVRTGCPHFGLLVGQSMNLQSLGHVGLLARNAPNVASALRSLAAFLHLHARGAVMGLTVDPGLATLSYDAYQPAVEATDQVGDAATAMMLNVMRTLCGADFQPIEARFAHRKPEDVRPFRKFFKIPLRFDAEHYALVFASDWLDRQVPGNDAELERLLRRLVPELGAKHGDEFPEMVRGILRSALLTEQASAGRIAALFAMHVRTLSRRLEESGTSFRELVDEGRFEIARQMLEDTSLDVGQIAEALGYTRPSAFTRAFRRWSGTTPASWRATHVSRK
ncbi:MAG: AraC family transcriptional regulator [Xanthomonadales bacterium]|jgi:AraC-like DNA-binding protein|nr:AraC family transcriptional regulator [Xanthomonadales bacterium]